MIELSVIIPSYNGANKLPNVLERLSEQQFKNFEVVIIVDGSDDNSQLVIKRHKYPYPIQVLTQDNQGRSASRNNGVERAKAELLVFLDDDMLPENDFLQKHYDFHQQHPKSILVGCAFRNPNYAKKSFDHFLIYVEKEWKHGLSDTFKVSIEKFAFTGANFSIHKSEFYIVGKFKGILPDTEDFDFGVRALINHIDIYYNIHVLAWHNDFCGLEQFIKRLQEYKKSNKKLFDINPHYKVLFPKHTIVKRQNRVKLLVLLLVYKLKLQQYWVHSFLFDVMPLQVKFWFYKLIISAHLNYK